MTVRHNSLSSVFHILWNIDISGRVWASEIRLKANRSQSKSNMGCLKDTKEVKISVSELIVDLTDDVSLEYKEAIASGLLEEPAVLLLEL